jgi:histidine triad (HIT) family protein
MLAFHDIHPVAPVHFLVIPKEHVESLASVEERHNELLGRMMQVVPRLSREQGSNDGFRLIVNTGRVGRQEVNHLHLHVLGGNDPLPAMIYRQRS